MKKGIMLDIGCGPSRQPGWTGMDARPMDGVDVVHNWDEFPWPFEDESVLTAMASHVVEHVNPVNGNFLRWMDEVWRILVPDGQFLMVMPYAGSPGFWQDPTHINGCNEMTWFYFDPEPGRNRQSLWGIYKPKPWRIQKLIWDPVYNMEVLLQKRGDWHE